MTIAPQGQGAAAAVLRAASQRPEVAAVRRTVKVKGAAAAVPRAASRHPRVAAVRRTTGSLRGGG